MRSLHWGGGGGVKFCLICGVNFTLGPISAIRRAPTHQDTIEQGVLRTVLSACELLRAENHWLIWSDSVRSVITFEFLTITYEKIASPDSSARHSHSL